MVSLDGNIGLEPQVVPIYEEPRVEREGNHIGIVIQIKWPEFDFEISNNGITAQLLASDFILRDMFDGQWVEIILGQKDQKLAQFRIPKTFFFGAAYFSAQEEMQGRQGDSSFKSSLFKQK